jgi:hypothetical protein
MTRAAPTRVTVLLWLVLWFTVWNSLRLWTAISWRERLEEFASSPGPLYIGATGLIWAAAGVLTFWSFWKARRWTRNLILGTSVTYTAWYWADRLLLQQPRSNWLFAALLNLLVIIFILFTLRSGFFQREAYERDPEDRSVE